jgi:hypothetical protein
MIWIFVNTGTHEVMELFLHMPEPLSRTENNEINSERTQEE